MRKLIRFLAPLVAGLLLPATAQASTTSSYSYIAAIALASGGSVSARGQNLAPLGGFTITPASTTVTVKIEDTASASGVPYSVCQENDTTTSPNDVGNLCGDGGDDIGGQTQCSTGASKTFTGFKPGNPVGIFIFAEDTSCDGVGSTGTATVTY